MSRVAAAHADWLGLLDSHGQFLTLPVLREVMPDGLDRSRPELRAEVRARLESRTDDVAVRTAWLEFLLRDVLGWRDRLRSGVAIPAELNTPVPEHHQMLRPDYVLMGPVGAGQPGERARVLVMRFPLGTDLTTRIPGEQWVASPIDRVARMCRATGVPVGVATDTGAFALVHAPVNKPVGYGIWPTELLGEEQGLLDALVTVLGAKRLFAVRTDHQLEAMLTKSASAEHEVTAQLGKQVRRAVEMLVAALSRANNEHGGRLLAGVDPHAVYEATVTVMMRLVFLLYAEERHLLPLGDPVYDANYAASTLREQLRAEADTVGDEPLELRATAWHRLLATFRAVHAGITHDQLRLPAYGGSLFDPDRFPFLEGRAPGESWRRHTAAPIPVDDATVLAALTALQELEITEGGVTASRKLSFRTLDVEQIGHVYEGLLDHGAMRVEEIAVGLIGKSGLEAEVPLTAVEAKAAAGRDALVTWLVEQTGKSAAAVQKALDTPADADLTRLLRTACENDAAAIARVQPYARLLREDLRGLPMVFLPGSVYVTETTSRRDSGTEYTTKDLADEIVRHTLEPLVYSPGPADGTPREEWKLKSSDDILALRVADPTVGSGAIIVAACRYLADRLVEAWVAEGKAAPRDDLADDVDDLVIEARRAIADQCLYGVDRDPMAVEMAKLSIWLTTMARERPFSFLDHAFRAGDSLLGLTSMEQVEHLHVDPARSQAQLQFVDELQPRIKSALAKRQELEAIPVTTVRDADEKARLNAEANAALDPVRLVADVVAGAALSTTNGKAALLDTRLLAVQQQVADALDPVLPADRRAVALEELQQLAGGWLNAERPSGAPLRRPLHWPVAFPEVFADGGFHALCGNPPFLGGTKISGPMGKDYRTYLGIHVAGRNTDRADLVAFFFLRAAQLVRPGGHVGFLATNSISQGDTRETGLDALTQRGFTIYRAIKSRPWPGSATLEVAEVWMRRGAWNGELSLGGQVVPGITTTLDVASRVSGRPRPLPANAGRTFEGWKPQGMGFILTPEQAEPLRAVEACRPLIQPFINGSDLNSSPMLQPSRYIINFGTMSLEQAEQFPALIQIVRDLVKPERDKSNRAAHKARWWQFGETRPGLVKALTALDRVIAMPRVSKTLAPAFLPKGIVYSEALVIFAFDDDFHFGVLTSHFHYWWAITHASTMRTDLRYTPSDCFETFAFPAESDQVAVVAAELDAVRRATMLANEEGLTKTYNRVHDRGDDTAGITELRDLHRQLDEAVAAAYGWTDLPLEHGFHDTDQGPRYTFSPAARTEMLDRLLELNHERATAVGPPSPATRRRGRTTAAAENATLPLFPSLSDEETA